MTQVQLAERVGVSTAFISRVERGQKMMKVHTLYATAQALNVSCDALICQEGQTASLENIKKLLDG
jgi:transcriptional regulator with XRE-family HTH domain